MSGGEFSGPSKDREALKACKVVALPEPPDSDDFALWLHWALRVMHYGDSRTCFAAGCLNYVLTKGAFTARQACKANAMLDDVLAEYRQGNLD